METAAIVFFFAKFQTSEDVVVFPSSSYSHTGRTVNSCKIKTNEFIQVHTGSPTSPLPSHRHTRKDLFLCVTRLGAWLWKMYETRQMESEQTCFSSPFAYMSHVCDVVTHQFRLRFYSISSASFDVTDGTRTDVSIYYRQHRAQPKNSYRKVWKLVELDVKNLSARRLMKFSRNWKKKCFLRFGMWMWRDSENDYISPWHSHINWSTCVDGNQNIFNNRSE